MTVRRIVVVNGGLGQPSSTRLLAERLAAATSDALLEHGVEADVEVVDLRGLAHPLADAVVTGFATGELRKAVEAMSTADGVVAVSPVYQASFSGLFKMFFDVLDEGALAGTPVLLAATAGTARHSLVIEHALRPMFAHLKAVTVPSGVVAASEDWGSARAEQSLGRRVDAAAAELAALVAARPERTTDGAFEVVVPFDELLAGP
jgi:FMN reductase